MKLHRQVWLIGALFLSAIDVADAQPRRVLLLHSFGPNFAPWSDVAVRFREELPKRSLQPIDFFEASLETARLVLPNGDKALVDYLKSIFLDQSLDLVVALGAPAARFFQHYRADIFPSTPMLIAAAAEGTFNDAALTPYDTTVAVRIDQAVSIKNILRLLPDTTRIAVVIGDSPLERFWINELRREYEPFTGKVTFEFLNKLSTEEMVTHVGELPPRSAVYYATVRVDVHGVPPQEDRMVAKLHAAANAPMFSYMDTKFGQGIVGGPLLSAQRIANESAGVAVRILNGESPGTIKTSAIEFEAPIYDWRELQRWNIAEARLPSGSTVHFREPTLWESYRWPITILALSMFALSVTTASLLIERHRRHDAERYSRKRLLEVIHLSQSAEMGALSASFAHDLRQPLGSIALNAESAEFMLEADQLPLSRLKATVSDIRQANQHASEIIQSMGTLLKRKEGIELQIFDLKDVITDALQILSHEARKRNVALDVNSCGNSFSIRGDRVHLQQLFLNLVMNSMEAMHNDATAVRRIKIETVMAGEASVEISVSDTGPGIPAQRFKEIFATFHTTKEGGTGLGLSIARLIVENHGGTIWAENRAGGGALFRFTLPLSRAGGLNA